LSKRENVVNSISFDKLRMTFMTFTGFLRQPPLGMVVFLGTIGVLSFSFEI
jgi:hypothetical protein